MSGTTGAGLQAGLPNILRLEPLPVGFPVDEAPGEFQSEAGRHLDRLLRGHLGVEQGRHLLQIG